MGRVRAFTFEDIPQAIELNRKLFPASASLSRETQEYIFSNVCFNNPWHDQEISSLVYEENDGTIIGFLGVIPRSMVIDGQKLRIAASQHLMVDRTTLASVQLFKHFLAGPQDLSIADMAVDVARSIWERLGGVTIFHHSFYWRRPIQPLSFAVSFLKKNRTSTHPTTNKTWSIIDGVIAKMPLNPFHPVKPIGRSIDLTIDEFLSNIDGFTSVRKLKPVYNHDSISWLFDVLAHEKRFGTFQKKAVYNDENRLIGWYLYNLKPQGRSEVIQVVGDKRTIKTVIDHLFYSAWQGKTVELCGRLDPFFMKEFYEKYCLFIPGRNWMCIHSRNPEIIQTIQSGDSFLTRLEGDLWFF